MRILSTTTKQKVLNRQGFKKVTKVLPQLGLPLGIVLLMLIFFLITPGFISMYNIMNILRQLVTLALVSCGMTYVLISGGVDLSAGSVMAVAGIVVSMMLLATNNIFISILVAVVSGMIFGLVNGVIVARLHVQAFAVTLGTMQIAAGATMLLSDGNTIRNLPKSFAVLASADVAGIPLQVIVLVAILIIAYILLQKTPYGSYLYAAGGNEKAAILSGVNVVKIKVTAYMICSVTAAIASVIATSRAMTGNPTLGTGMGMQGIAAAIIGGASMSGGRGSMRGTIFGALFITILYSGLNLVRVSSFIQDLLIGLIIIGSAWLDVSRRKRVG